MCALKWCIVWFSTRETGKKNKKTKPIGSRSNCKAQLLPTKICMLWDGLLKSPIYFRFKKKKKEIDIYIVSAECPWKVELHFAPFMLKLMHIPYFFFIFIFLHGNFALLQREFQATDECRDVAAACTHCVPLTSPPINAPEGFFSLFLSFHLPCPPLPKNSCQWV